VGGTDYNNHSLDPFKELLNSMPGVYFPALLSIVNKSRVQAKPATLLIPIGTFFNFLMEESGRGFEVDSFP